MTARLRLPLIGFVSSERGGAVVEPFYETKPIVADASKTSSWCRNATACNYMVPAGLSGASVRNRW